MKVYKGIFIKKQDFPGLSLARLNNCLLKFNIKQDTARLAYKLSSADWGHGGRKEEEKEGEVCF